MAAKTAILLHGRPDEDEYYDPGIPSASNNHWFPWLQKQLLIRDIAAYTPEIPNAWRPHYPTWCQEFERYDITPETLLVGHSTGGGFLLRWLSEHPEVGVGKVVLVAPYLGFDHGDADFFECTIDPHLASRTTNTTMFGSDNDMSGIVKTVQLIRATIANISYREFPGYGHFCIEEIGTTFPELLAELIGEQTNDHPA